MGTTMDAAFVIDLLNRQPAALAKALAMENAKASTFLTAPVLYEVLAGVLHSQSRTEASAFRSFAGRFPILSFDEPSARRAAEVRAEFMRLGRAKPGVDVMIAGIALNGDHALVTRDGDFAAISEEFGLRVEPY